jgi:ANTAR domain
VDAGLRAQLAIQLYYDDETLGGLNLYATKSAEIDPDAPVAAELFAVHAALALGRARTESRLSEALGSRQMIGEAVGLMMERYKINDQRAFQFLARACSTSNIKVRDVAQEVVDESNRLYAPGANAQSGPLGLDVVDRPNPAAAARARWVMRAWEGAEAECQWHPRLGDRRCRAPAGQWCPGVPPVGAWHLRTNCEPRPGCRLHNWGGTRRRTAPRPDPR